MGMSPQRTQKGFTIVEMLLASVISVMVIGGAYMGYDASQATALAHEGKGGPPQVIRGDVRLPGGAGIADPLFAVQPNPTATCAAPPCLVSAPNVFTVNAAQSIAAQSVIAFNIQSLTFEIGRAHV